MTHKRLYPDCDTCYGLFERLRLLGHLPQSSSANAEGWPALAAALTLKNFSARC